MNCIRIGIIGAGAKAAEHAEWFRASPETVVAAVADPDLMRARALAARCEARACDRYEQLLDDVDAVIVASPNRFHKTQTIACAEAGRHVYCEKPAGLSSDDARQMADAVQRAGVQSALGFTVRHHPTIQTLHRLVLAGDIGRLVSIWSRRVFTMDRASLHGWRADHSESGGLLLEVNLHEIDWMMMVGGSVESVYARSSATVSQGPVANDHWWVTLNYTNGAHGLHEGSWASAIPAFIRGAHGTAGGAQTDEWGGQLMVASMGEKRRDARLDPAFDLRQNFIDAIHGEKEVSCNLHWGVEVMTVADAIFASARTGKAVNLLSTALTSKSTQGVLE